MSLSVVCVTSANAHRVGAILDLLRTVADELVVVVASTDRGGDLESYAHAADRVHRVPEAVPQGPVEWAHLLCRGDWILRVDGDEVPSAALVQALPRLVARDDVLQYRIPRRWLFPTPRTWLDSHPWSVDYRIRLVRNDPATLRFTGPFDEPVEPALPARYLEEPVYSLDLVRPRHERERIAAAMEQSRGRPDPVVLYVPELRADVETRTVPPPDRSAIDRVLAAPRKRVADPRREADEQRSAQRPLPAAAYRAEVVPLQPRIELTPGDERELPVRVVNRGSARWPWGDVDPRIRLSYRTDGGIDGPRTLFSADVAPGDSTVVPLRVVAPSMPGRHQIEIDLVHENVRWFGCGARVTLDVVDQQRVSTRPRPTAPVVCITGMHRSGTSLVARVVNLLGVDFGAAHGLIPGASDNEKGYWENAAIVRLNDEILAALGGSAVAPPPLHDGWERLPELEPLRRRAERLIAETLPGPGPIGWKDPRTSLTLPFWRHVVGVTATVLCVRDPIEVARSLQARQQMDPEKAAQLWLTYVICSYRADPGRLVVRYDEFFEDAESAARRLAAFLGLSDPTASTLAEIGSFVEWRLRHHRVSDEAQLADSESMALARSLYRVLAAAPAEAAPLVEVLRATARAEDPAGAGPRPAN